jgi:hypothetical protein
MTRETSGGFEARFIVRRTDGEPSIEAKNPQMAADLRDALEHPERWPAQHENAK